MIFISIDIETTGLDPQTCQILEVGAVFVDTSTDMDNLPTFERILYHPVIYGEPFAINMNIDIIREMLDNPPDPTLDGKSRPFHVIHPSMLAKQLYTWIYDLLGDRYPTQPPITINFAGKNPKFDLSFLKKLHDWDMRLKVHHRVLDPAILYADWSAEALPNLGKCLEQIGENKGVKHRALDDAYDVARLIIHHIKSTRSTKQ